MKITKLRNYEITKKRSGYALLVALLVTTTIVAGSAALARVIIANLRQNQFVDRATTALIAASSGLEQGLFWARRLERVPAPGEVITLASGNATVSVRINDDLAAGARFSIPKDDSVVLDLPADVSVAQVKIPVWTTAEECASSWIETALSSWNEGFSTVRGLHSSTDVPITLDLQDNGIQKQLRIKSLYCDIKQLEVVALSGVNTIPLPARVVLDSVGEYQGSRQMLRAIFPATPPLSNLFDFVLFSGSPIKKGN